MGMGSLRNRTGDAVDFQGGLHFEFSALLVITLLILAANQTSGKTE
jgi:hypothetical protein